jgi:hypothetical protein
VTDRARWAELTATLWPPYSWADVMQTLAAYSDFLLAASKALLIGSLLVGLLAGTVTYLVALAAIHELRRGRPPDQGASHDRQAA